MDRERRKTVLKKVRSIMEERRRRFSTVQQISPDTLKVIKQGAKRLDAIDDIEEGHVETPGALTAGAGAHRKQSLQHKLTSTLGNLALFKDDDDVSASHEGTGASFIAGYTTPGPKERATSAKKKANLGVMLGVYLPTIQHILGVTMFIRLFWVVGVAGIWHTMLLLFLCCACTLLTSISLSAVATNGVVESGGAYFMISRNLGAEFGSAVGILFYLANTVATSMYLVGGVEVLLLYIYPDLTIGGEAVHSDTGVFGMMSHNYRIYGTALLLLELIIVALGVRFVQLLAPISLACVILSIFACFAGGAEKALLHNGQHVCMLEDHLLSSRVLNIPHGVDISNICDYCKKGDKIGDEFCEGNATSEVCQTYTGGSLRCVNAFPGFNPAIMTQNLNPQYLHEDQAIMRERYADKTREVYQDVATSFFLLLAIYFPAVTGIMTGTNMSGDLRDPQQSIPSGTIAATITTSIIYFSLALLFGSSIAGPVLRDKNGKSIHGSLVVASLAWPSPWVVIIGSFLSTFGAALQCLCSAPRLLQSIAKDNVIPILSPFARVTKNNEPFLGLLVTTFIAELAILLGAVDAIAEVLDFFFLMCYAFVNLVCALHSLMGAPNWRPRFKYYHWSLSLAGAFLCFFIMFASCWYYALIACALTGIIYKYVEWKGAKKEWGDGIRGLALTTAQYSLMKVEDKDPHPKNWRPQLLILVDGKYSKETIDLRSLNLLNLAGQLKAGRGLAITVAFVKCATTRMSERKKAEEIKERVQQDMSQARLRGFGKALLYTDVQIEGAVSALYQSIGIGGLRPNTVMLNFPRMGENEDHTEQNIFAEQLSCGVQNENCMIVVKGITDFPKPNDRLRGYIDIWWIVQDGGILMLIAYLLQQHKVWRGCKLRIYVIAQEEQQDDAMKQRLQRHIYMLRIDANVFVNDDAVQKTIHMEQRTKALLKKNLSNGFANGGFTISDELSTKSPSTKSLEGSGPTLGANLNRLMDHPSTDAVIETSFIQKTFEGLDSNDTFTGGDGPINIKDIDGSKVQKMNAAVRMNQVILEYSTESQLVLLSLPKPPKSLQSLVENYLAYVEALTEKLPRVMLIGGSGKEVITVDS
ncbi:amino acid permease domain-containing protein [Ditylenchus destructor]|uniref:Amino acid permease domain-containing protein n=1 Tax=Ditylenchus destructor TaxID=166010 RepID=A0AAD4RDH7_9BILA|nr:amino acid permease domain-containing protein [Ditylenchus destructor]